MQEIEFLNGFVLTEAEFDLWGPQALAQLRKEKNDPFWVPTLLNGRGEYEDRIEKLVRGKRDAV